MARSVLDNHFESRKFGQLVNDSSKRWIDGMTHPIAVLRNRLIWHLRKTSPKTYNLLK